MKDEEDKTYFKELTIKSAEITADIFQHVLSYLDSRLGGLAHVDDNIMPRGLDAESEKISQIIAVYALAKHMGIFDLEKGSPEMEKLNTLAQIVIDSFSKIGAFDTSQVNPENIKKIFN